jgi:hypothetical protein
LPLWAVTLSWALLFDSMQSFYMRNNDDGKTVDAFDLMVPGRW